MNSCRRWNHDGPTDPANLHVKFNWALPVDFILACPRKTGVPLACAILTRDGVNWLSLLELDAWLSVGNPDLPTSQASSLPGSRDFRLGTRRGSDASCFRAQNPMGRTACVQSFWIIERVPRYRIRAPPLEVQRPLRDIRVKQYVHPARKD